MEEDGNYQVKKGDLTETVIMPELLKKEDIYSDSQYSVYLNGLRYYECIKNNSNPDGKKMLMILYSSQQARKKKQILSR